MRYLDGLFSLFVRGGGLSEGVEVETIELGSNLTATHDPATNTATISAATVVLPQWHTVHSTDFAAQATQGMTAEGTYTVNGVTWTRQGTELNTSFPNGIVDAGLAILPLSAYSPPNQEHAPPCLSAALETLVGAPWHRAIPLRATINFVTNIYEMPNDASCYLALLARGSGTRSGYYAEMVCSGAPQAPTSMSAGSMVAGNLGVVVNAGTGAPLLASRQMQIELPNGFGRGATFRAYSAYYQLRDLGYLSALNAPAATTLLGASDFALGHSSNWFLEIGFARGGHSNAAYGPPVITSLQLEAFY